MFQEIHFKIKGPHIKILNKPHILTPRQIMNE
jgi:hypothetical protein